MGRLSPKRTVLALLLLSTFGLLFYIIKPFLAQERLVGTRHLHFRQENKKELVRHAPSVAQTFNKVDYAKQAYDHGWVGFKGLKTIDCTQVLTAPLPNDKYPQNVSRPSLEAIVADTIDCQAFRFKYGFDRHPPVTAEEETFPLAFVFLVHVDLDQVLFLLRNLYRRHNAYCVSMDLNAGTDLLGALKGMASCLPNVFVARTLYKIVYAGMSRLQADLSCMEELLDHNVQWRYVINMPGQNFPLRTNLEMVRILKTLNGTNDIEGITEESRLYKYRYRFLYKPYWDKTTNVTTMKKTKKRNNKPPPCKLTIVKGSTYGSFSRRFVQFIVHSNISKAFQSWLQGVYSPDEYFYATLNFDHKAKAPGGFTGNPQSKEYLTSFSLWKDNTLHRCASLNYVRHICIFSTGDLPTLLQQKHLMANKFKVFFHPTALHCMDQFLFNLTIDNVTRDIEYYSKLRKMETAML